MPRPPTGGTSPKRRYLPSGNRSARADYGTVRSEPLGAQSADYTTNHVATFRNSGAAALLTRYVRRRAGAL